MELRLIRQPRQRVGLVLVASLLILAGAQILVAASGNAADPLLSRGKPVATSSNESTTLDGPKAVDGNPATRWGSAEGSDPQWIRVDLGTSANISRVNLSWEAAFGRAYKIQVSLDGNAWTDVYSTSTGDGGTDDLAVTGRGRYVRMHGTQRGTPYGYSLWEFQVYGNTAGGGPDTQPPTTPPNLRSTGSTATSVSLAWDAATDNVGVTGYEIFRNGAAATTVPGTTATLTGLSASTAYRFKVRARDAAGNTSPFGAEVSVTTPGSGGGGGTPVASNGQLRVCGTKLCNQYGKPIQLRGMSTHGLQWYPQCVNDASLDALANDWNADVIRLSMYIQEGGYETDPRHFTNLMHSLIEKATARGMYAIVDWHQLTPGDPNANLNLARTFFTEIAQRHGSKPNILYDVANEPNGVSWARVKAYHQAIIPVIRAQDPDSVILLGTHGWGSLGVSDGGSEADVINNQVNATNILYTFHFYAASHGSEYLNALSRAADRIPMFVTEFGTQTASGDGGNNFARSQQYLDLMASKKISWVNWNFSDDHRSGAVFTTGTCPGGPFAGTSRLKPAGQWVRERIRTPADDFPTR